MPSGALSMALFDRCLAPFGLQRRAISIRDPFGASFFESPVAAGVRIDETTGEQIHTVFSCIRVIASGVATLPLKLQRLTPDGRRIDAVDHPLYELLHDLANPEQTSSDFREEMTRKALIWGQSFAEIIRNPSGQPVALWALDSSRMFVDRDERNRLRFRYHFSSRDRRSGEQTWLYDPARPPLLRIVINSLDGGMTGRSPIRVLRETHGWAAATERFGASFFGNGSTFGGLLKAKAKLRDGVGDRLKKQIEQGHKGPNKAHSFIILEDGLEYEKLGVNPDDAQFLDSVKLQRSILCGAYGVPGHMISDTDRSVENLESESLRWLRDGLDPWLVKFEQSIKRDLLGPRSFGMFEPRFVRQAAVRTDFKTRQEGLAVMGDHGVLTRDEWRELEDMSRLAEGGDLPAANMRPTTTNAPQPDNR